MDSLPSSVAPPLSTFLPEGLFVTASAAGDRTAIETWANEGGHFPAFSGARGGSDLERDPETREASSDRVATMATRLRHDVADGLVGRHHNTYQHRSRVVRQLTARLEAEESIPCAS